jgi:hypothetical protein
MNDVIVFSFSLSEHFAHLNEVLTLLNNFDVTLSLKKCHFVYSSIKALRHHVSRLRLSILKKKIEIIKVLRFSKTLRDLEIELKFFDYYRKFVS